MELGSFNDFDKYLSVRKLDPKGCFVDTSVLFAASYPSDRYNEDAELVFKVLSRLELSSFTNVNVKYEFLEKHRRVLLADALVEFFRIYENQLPLHAVTQLKSFETRHRKKLDENESSQLEPQQQKKFSRLLREVHVGSSNGWEILCKDFLLPQIESVWDEAVEKLRIVEVKTRAIDNPSMLNKKPKWEDVIQLMGNHAIASADAMILNFFNNSKIDILLTADSEMAKCVLTENRAGKLVFVPDDMYEELKSGT